MGELPVGELPVGDIAVVAFAPRSAPAGEGGLVVEDLVVIEDLVVGVVGYRGEVLVVEVVGSAGAVVVECDYCMDLRSCEITVG